MSPACAVDLNTLVHDFAAGVVRADSLSPVAQGQRSKRVFKPGIGPHCESDAVVLVMKELQSAHPARYGAFSLGVPYPNQPRQKCDLCLGSGPDWDWAIEIKLLRFLGDNGLPNDNMLMHILSPYAADRSALTDCSKLLGFGAKVRTAIVIYGFEHEDWPLAPAIDAFELLARARANLSARCEAVFENLVHPVHSRGRVFGWEVVA